MKDNNKIQTTSENEALPNIEIEQINFSKKNKTSNVLLIIGSIFFVVSFILMCLFGSSVIQHYLATESEKLGSAIGMVVFFIYFGLPSLISGAISSILNIISFCIGKKQRVLKLLFSIFSILTIILNIIFIIMMNGK